LRIPHFFGLHALQALPLFALVLRRWRLPADSKVRLTLTAAGSYLALFAILLVQALRGQPVLNPDTLTIETLGAWAVVTAICAWRSVARIQTIGVAELV
jgi:hypothetical protein